LNSNFEILDYLNRATIVHHIEPSGKVWATDKKKIIVYGNGQWLTFSEFPFCKPRDYFSWSRPTARAFRSDKCNVYVNQAGMVMGIRGGVVYSFSKKNAQPLFSIQGDCVLHGSICEDDEGWTYFGEYFMNGARKPVRIWRISADLSKWEIAYQSEAGSIRHIHGIYRDPFLQNVMWACVGDFTGECYLYRTDDQFRHIKRFGDGSQIWRAVRLFFTSDYVCWLTDSNLEPNHACRMSRKDGSLTIGQAVDSPSWYGCTLKGDWHLAFTTVERGPAVLTHSSSILVSEDAFHWQVVKRFKKDILRPVQVFKYGVISCPSGTMKPESFYLSGEGLVGLDGRSIRARLIVEDAGE